MTTTTAETPRARKAPRRLDRGPGPLQRVKWSAQALVLAAFWQVAGLMSPDRAAAFGRALVRRLSSRLGKSALIRRNLSLVCPEMSKEQIARLTGEVWGSVGQLLADYAHLDKICVGERDARLEVVLNWDVDAYRRAGKPVVFVTAHLANWELAAAHVTALGVPLSVVYSPLENPILDRMLQRKRQVMGCDFLPKTTASRQMLRALQNGTSVGLLVDQRVSDGVPVPFFGRAALTSVTPARLALKFGCDLVPIQVERLGGARFRLTFHHPVRPADEAADSQEQALDMTRRVNEHFESWIRKRPEQWICWKRRWPKSTGARAGRGPAPQGESHGR